VSEIFISYRRADSAAVSGRLYAISRGHGPSRPSSAHHFIQLPRVLALTPNSRATDATAPIGLQHHFAFRVMVDRHDGRALALAHRCVPVGTSALSVRVYRIFR
jgi:hypothetical protein